MPNLVDHFDGRDPAGNNVEILLRDTSTLNFANQINNNLTTLSNNVGSLTDLTTTDKSSVVSAVNEVKTIADNASSGVAANSAKIGTLSDLDTTDKSNLVNAINEVLDNAGIYNKSTPGSGLTTNIGLREGTYSVSSDTTINAQLVVPKGAIINIASGVTLTINGSILADRYKIFSGSGNIVVNPANQPVGYPEWFGAKADDNTVDNTSFIEKCISIFCITELSSGDYYVNGTINIENSNRTLRGVKQLNWSYTTANKRGTRIITKANTSEVILVGTESTPASINDSVQNVVLEDFTVTRTTGSSWLSNSIGVRFSQALRCRVRRVTAFNNDLGFILQACTNLHIDDSMCFSEVLPGSDTTRTLRHIFIDNSVVSPNGTPNVSIYVRNNILNTGGGIVLNNSGGIVVSSSTHVLSDMFFYENAIEWVHNGIELTGDNTIDHTHDIHISHNEMDVITGNGIIFLNANTGSTIVIEDNYIAPAAGSDNPFSGIRINAGGGFELKNNVVVSKNYGHTYGMYITGCSSISSDNILTECEIGVYGSNLTCCQFNDNITLFDQTGIGVQVTDTSHSKINVSIHGDSNKFSSAVRLEGSSAANEVDVTKIFTSAVSSGTSHYVYVNNQYASAVGTLNGNLITGVMA